MGAVGVPVPAPTASVAVPVPMPVPVPAPSVVVPPPGVDPRKQSEEFGAFLEADLKKKSDAVIQEAALKKQMLEEQAKRDLAQFTLAVEEEKSMQMLQVDKEAMAVISGLQEAAITRKTV